MSPKLVAAVSLALLSAGCGGSAKPPAASTQASGALAFARCMRSNGVSSFADPNGSGQLAKETPQQLGVSDARFQAAQSACAHRLPNGGAPTPAALQQSWSEFRSFAGCMRRHVVADWPDPTRYPRHPERPTFDLQAAGIDASAPQVETAIHACAPLLHGNNPQHLGEAGS